jgi:hypothetical protein
MPTMPTRFVALIAAIIAKEKGPGNTTGPYYLELASHPALGPSDRGVPGFSTDLSLLARCESHVGSITVRDISGIPGYESPPVVGESVSKDLLSYWIRNCSRAHLKCSREHLDTPPEGFRLIDVMNACVILAVSRCRFVTLSYVW